MPVDALKAEIKKAPTEVGALPVPQMTAVNRHILNRRTGGGFGFDDILRRLLEIEYDFDGAGKGKMATR